ncbi:hypothetical protein Ahy_B08g090317 [Arachis hypogaea]|uniref:Uncharacterized protein n=1 Tax=Arachis hypogaea TaxID=3818 RepID=A0A444Y005_ARAHY|nr:hypothetical protein Ahy_B08g090317 [Arachis hypogaea]
MAFEEGHRWGHMTTNLVECINSVLKGVTALKSTEAQECINAGHAFSEFTTVKLQENLQASGNIQVHHMIDATKFLRFM